MHPSAMTNGRAADLGPQNLNESVGMECENLWRSSCFAAIDVIDVGILRMDPREIC